MRSFVDGMLEQLKEYLGKMSGKAKTRMFILSAVVVVLAIFAVVLLSRTRYELMHEAQSMAEAGEVQLALLEMGIPARVEGLSVYVPEGRVSELRNTLAAQDVIGISGPNYDLLGDASGFAVTDRHAQKLYEILRASEIRAHILLAPRIQNAIVTMNYGEASPFIHRQLVKEPAAVVTLTVRDGSRLSNSEVQAITEIVKNNVPGIRYENITIVDNNLNHYTVGENIGEDSGVEMHTRINLQNKLQQQMQAAGEQLLMPVLGANNVRVMVTLRLNFDRVFREIITFDPPVAGELDGLARSRSEIFEAHRREADAEGIPGTDPNGMGTVEYPFIPFGDDELYTKAVRETNFELNSTKTIIEEADGRIEYLSVAVAVNNMGMEADYTTEIAALVSTGMGIPMANVAVMSIPFPEDTSREDAFNRRQELEALERRRELIQTIIQWAVILLLGLSLMTLIRTIVKGGRPPEPEPVLADGMYGIDYMVGGDDDITDVTELEEVELQTKSTGLEQIERFIERDPDAVAQLLRNWLSDE
jgi:flagellar M-ring protein FliF